MLLVIALLIYLLVVICAFLILYRNGIRKWSALIFSIVVGWIALNIIIPPHKSFQEFDNSFLPGIYLLVELGTLPVIIVYVLIICLHDK